jgi:hypothetical protein
VKPARLDTANVFSRVFAIYRAQAAVLLPAALIVSLIPAAISVPDTRTAKALSLAALFIFGVWFQGMVAEAVRDIQDDRRDLSIGGLFRSVAGVLGPLIWTALIVVLAVFAGLLAFIIPGLVIGTLWSVAAPAVVIERNGPMKAIGRSRELVRGHGWQVFGVLIVMLAIVLLIQAAFQTLGVAVADSGIAYAAAVLAGSAITAPMFALATSVLYLELRRLKGEPRPPAGPSVERES